MPGYGTCTSNYVVILIPILFIKLIFWVYSFFFIDWWPSSAFHFSDLIKIWWIGILFPIKSMTFQHSSLLTLKFLVFDENKSGVALECRKMFQFWLLPMFSVHTSWLHKSVQLIAFFHSFFSELTDTNWQHMCVGFSLVFAFKGQFVAGLSIDFPRNDLRGKSLDVIVCWILRKILLTLVGKWHARCALQTKFKWKFLDEIFSFVN